MKLPKIVMLSIIAIACLSQSAYAKAEKWYRVEMIIFEMDSKAALIDDIANAGSPSVSNAVSLSNDPEAEFSILDEKQLVLKDAKRRIQKRYHLVMHKGWRQIITDKEHAQRVHLMGGKDLAGEFEVNGTVRLSSGRNINVDTDLLLKKLSTQSGSSAYRLKESSRLRLDEISYIDNPKYGVLVMVTPEKTQAENKVIVEQPAPAVKEKGPAPVTDDSPIIRKKT